MISIDRIESQFAVCEIDGVFENIPLEIINGAAAEGDILIKNGERYDIDKAATAARRKKLAKLQEELFK